MRTSALLVLFGLAGVPAFGQRTFFGQDVFPKSPAPAPPRFEFKDLPQFKGSGEGRLRLFVVPNPSGANAHFTLEDQVTWYDRLDEFLRS